MPDTDSSDSADSADSSFTTITSDTHRTSGSPAAENGTQKRRRIEHPGTQHSSRRSSDDDESEPDSATSAPASAPAAAALGHGRSAGRPGGSGGPGGEVRGSVNPALTAAAAASRLQHTESAARYQCVLSDSFYAVSNPPPPHPSCTITAGDTAATATATIPTPLHAQHRCCPTKLRISNPHPLSSLIPSHTCVVYALRRPPTLSWPHGAALGAGVSCGVVLALSCDM